MPSFKHNLLPRYELRNIDKPTGRVYVTPIGELPSVTNVLETIADKKALKAWRDRIGDEAADGISNQAKYRGSTVHTICERYLMNKSNIFEGVAAVNKLTFKVIQPILDEYVETVYGVELPLWSPILKTAGRTDVLAKINNSDNAIIDFKTLGRKPDIQSDRFRIYKLQTTVYAMMAEEIYKIDVPFSMIIATVDHEEPVKVLFRNAYYRDVVLDIFT